jgi:hypothetical protein
VIRPSPFRYFETSPEIIRLAVMLYVRFQQQKIAGMAASSRAFEALIQALRLTIGRLKRQRYGSRSTKIEREIAQQELALEGLKMVSASLQALAKSAGSRRRSSLRLQPLRRRMQPRQSQRLQHEPSRCPRRVASIAAA